MTTYKLAQIECPKCHHKFEKELYDVIDVNKDPSLYARTISEEIFQVSCPHCGFQINLNQEFHFVNHQSKYSVHHVSSEDSLIELCDSFDVLDNYKHRVILNNKGKAIEKIMLLEKGYDDRVIEIAKYMLLNSFMETYHINDPKLVQVVVYIEKGKAVPLFYHLGETRKGHFGDGLLKDIESSINFWSNFDEDYIVNEKYVEMILKASKYQPIHYQFSVKLVNILLLRHPVTNGNLILYSQNSNLKIGDKVTIKINNQEYQCPIIEIKMVLKKDLPHQLRKLLD